MPSKLDNSESLRFLHACLQCSDYFRIDYARVASRFGIQAPAARMRFARLNAALGGKSKARRRQNAGQRNHGQSKVKHEKEGLELGVPREDDGDDQEDIVVAKREREEGVRVKDEDAEFMDGEAEVPLMRERSRHQQQQQQQRELPMFAPPSGLPIFGAQNGLPMFVPREEKMMYGGSEFQYGQPYSQPFMPLAPPQMPIHMRAPSLERMSTPIQQTNQHHQSPYYDPPPQTPRKVSTLTRSPAPMQRQDQPMFEAPYYGPPPGHQRLPEVDAHGENMEG